MKILLLTSLTLILAGNAAAVNYVEHVLPIFEKKCFDCHSVKEGKDKGNVQFDHLEDIAEFHIGKYARMIPFDSKESLLLDWVSDATLDDTMPPSGKGERLTDSEIATVKKWLDEGAVMTKEDEEASAEKAKEMKLAELKEMDWVNTKGQTIKAKCLAVDATHVTFLMANGSEVKYPLAGLTAESQAQAKAQAEPSE
ncbi:MAG: mono/diheme cytochrome c family protein [Verrucomicrobiales bacterium]|jgi:mono/diheme cytochrome c family protein